MPERIRRVVARAIRIPRDTAESQGTAGTPARPARPRDRDIAGPPRIARSTPIISKPCSSPSRPRAASSAGAKRRRRSRPKSPLGDRLAARASARWRRCARARSGVGQHVCRDARARSYRKFSARCDRRHRSRAVGSLRSGVRTAAVPPARRSVPRDHPVLRVGPRGLVDRRPRRTRRGDTSSAARAPSSCFCRDRGGVSRGTRCAARRVRRGGRAVRRCALAARRRPRAAVRPQARGPRRRLARSAAVPEDIAGHARLARRAAVPIAIGESYRTRFELRPFFERGP